MSENRAAVIGAAGFLGSVLTRRLQTLGVEVATYTRSDPFLRSDHGIDAGVASAKSVFWLASSIRPATAGDHPEDVATDRSVLAKLLEGLADSGAKPRLVAVSSGGTVYDASSPGPHSEHSPTGAVNEYGRAMLAIESLVGRWDRSTVLRVSNAYGPGQRPRNRQGVIAYWLSAIAEGSPVHLVGSDQVARDYIFVDDVIDALIAAHMSEHPPSVVNVGSGRPTTLADLLDQVRAVVAPIEVKVRRDPARSFDSPSTWLDVSLARQSLGWTPRTSVSEGLRLTWRWMNQTHPDRDPTNPGGHEADK